MTSIRAASTWRAAKQSLIAALCMSYAAMAAHAAPVPAPPGEVIAHSPAATRVYLGSPSLAVLPNGDYVASFDTFGPAAPQDRVSVFRSRDKGLTWSRLGDVPDQYWSSLFVLNGALYLMGTSRAWARRRFAGPTTAAHPGPRRPTRPPGCCPGRGASSPARFPYSSITGVSGVHTKASRTVTCVRW